MNLPQTENMFSCFRDLMTLEGMTQIELLGLLSHMSYVGKDESLHALLEAFQATLEVFTQQQIYEFKEYIIFDLSIRGVDVPVITPLAMHGFGVYLIHLYGQSELMMHFPEGMNTKIVFYLLENAKIPLRFSKDTSPNSPETFLN